MVQGRKKKRKREERQRKREKGKERGRNGRKREGIEKKGGGKRNERAKEEIKGGEGGKEHRKISSCYSLQQHHFKILRGPATLPDVAAAHSIPAQVRQRNPTATAAIPASASSTAR